MSEFARVAWLRQRLSTSQHVSLSVGDDAAVLSTCPYEQVWTVDALVEDVHFKTCFLDARQIGYRAYTTALSDLAAMGAAPRAGLVAMILPDVSEDYFRAIVEGIEEAATRFETSVAGGNLSSGDKISLTVTVLGTLQGPALTRSGARPGDAVYVTGPLGASHLGLEALLQSVKPAPMLQPFLDCYRRPEPRIREGCQLIGLASACLDISDGLLQDALHICEASEVGMRLHLNQIPTLVDHEKVAKQLGVDADHATLRGGEDYQLLFTAQAPVKLPFPAINIGEITRERGLVVIDRDGVETRPSARGHEKKIKNSE